MQGVDVSTAGARAAPADELSVVYARMSGLLLSEETVGTAVRLVTSLAVETLPKSIGAGVSLLDDSGRMKTTGTSDEVVNRADDLQYELDEGPCLVAWTNRVVVRVDDLAAETRWPRWTRAAARLGLGASLSAPLVAGDRALGALKVYAARPGVYDGRSEHRITMLAAQVAVLLANAHSRDVAVRYSEALTDALRTRDVISTAKGVVMARECVDEETAVALLTARAQREARTLRETALAVVRSTRRPRR